MPQTIDNLSATWSNSLTTYTAFKFNILDSASAAGSLLMDLQVGGSSKFNVSKGGVTTSSNIVVAPGIQNNAVSTSSNFALYSNALEMRSTFQIGWVSTTALSSPLDTIITRRAAANLRLGAADAAAPVAQTLSVQSVVAGTSNTAGANLTITGSQGTGTGAGGSIIFQVAPAGSSGTAQNALADVLMLSADQRTVGVPGWLRHSGAVCTFASNSFGIYNGGVSLEVANSIGFGAANLSVSSYDVVLRRDAANTLALRNGGTSGSPVTQTFNIYYWADGTNSEYMALGFQPVGDGTNFFGIRNQAVGTGGNKDVGLHAQGVANIRLATGGNSRWVINGSGHFLAGADNQYDIGATSSGRPRSLYIANSVNLGNELQISSTARVFGTTGEFRTRSAGAFQFSSDSTGYASPDLALVRSEANIAKITNGSTGGGAVELQEMTAPSAPATNNVRIYAEDNGSGKTRLMARFATGAAVQIAIEP